MKIIFLNINNHVDYNWSLVFAYLKAYLSKSDCFPPLKFQEISYYVREDNSAIESSIISSKPDLLAASCYVWNIKKVRKIFSSVKKKLPGVTTVVGGPEFAGVSQSHIIEIPGIDFIIVGEGEAAFKELIECLMSVEKRRLHEIEGLLFRDKNGKPTFTGERRNLISLDSMPSPFLHGFIDLKKSKNRTVCMETQRGCPYGCDYCLYPGVYKKIHFFDIDRVFREIELILENDPLALRIIDSAFNANKKRAKCILSHIIKLKREKGNNIVVYLEIIPEMLDKELIELMKETGSASVDFGIQTINKESLVSINRRRNDKKLYEAIDLSVKIGLNFNPQIIYGLPGEDMDSFFKTFDMVYAIPTLSMELSRLRLLPGTVLWENAKSHGILFDPDPPYFIEESDTFSREDILLLDILNRVVSLTMPMKVSVAEVCAFFNISPHRFFLDFIEANRSESEKLTGRYKSVSDKNRALNILENFYQYCLEMTKRNGKEIEPDLKRRLTIHKKRALSRIVMFHLKMQSKNAAIDF